MLMTEKNINFGFAPVHRIFTEMSVWTQCSETFTDHSRRVE